MDPTKEVSRELFEVVKPKCVELSDAVLRPQNSKGANNDVVVALKGILTVVETHKKQFSNGRSLSMSTQNSTYCISDNLADYIFFPISNLLKSGTLNVLEKRYLIGIIKYLLDSAWRFKPNATLFNQLHQLIVHLATDKIDYKSVASEDDLVIFELKNAILGCLKVTIGSSFNGQFDEDIKQLSLYGRTIDLTLTILATSTNPHSVEEIELVELCLNCMNQLIKLPILPDNLSRVFPGVVSGLVNFYVRSKTLNFKIICHIIDTLQMLIAIVFEDDNLLVYVEEPDRSHEKLISLWEDKTERTNHTETSIELELQDKSNVRSKSWLLATSKQLKISLTILFKDLISTKNRTKIQAKQSIGKHIFKFVEELFQRCFYSLFNDFTPLALDIISAIITIEQVNHQDDSKYLEIAQKLTLDSNIDEVSNKRMLLHRFTKIKIDDMIQNKLTLVFYSFDDERIELFLGSLKFHFAYLQSLSKDLSMDDNSVEILFRTFIKVFKRELENATSFGKRNSKFSTNDLVKALNKPVVTTPDEENPTISQRENKLDNIELPGHINASQVTHISNDSTAGSKLAALRNHFNSLRDISVDINEGGERQKMFFFNNIISKETENESADLINFVTGLLLEESICRILDYISTVDHKSSSPTTSQGIGLWIANSILKGCKYDFSRPVVDFNVNEFLDLESDDIPVGMTENNLISDSTYIVLDEALQILEDFGKKIALLEPIDIKKNVFQSRELVLSIALQSIGTVSKFLSIEDFQHDVLMDNLFMIIEALTFQSSPVVQEQAKECLNMITTRYYEGSLENLIRENLDYLIDSISIRLSSASSLTPSIPGILLVILKVSGVELLLNNQLNDVFLELFVLIDTYHGYSLLMEGFFAVFAELIEQIKSHYDKAKIHPRQTASTSNYKPWGLTSIEQALKLLDDSKKIVDSFQDYHRTEEYFTKRRDVPFSEQVEEEEADSDDESDKEQDKEEPWPSHIPEKIYHLLQRIFTYGFQLLSHPSMYLKNQILVILKDTYPLLASNSKLLLPLISNHWSELMPLTIGATNLSTSTPLQYEATQMNLIIPALDLVLVAINEDVNTGDTFLARKVLDMWDFWLQRVPIFNTNNSQKNNRDALSRLVINPNIIQAYIRVISRSLELYDKIIPDITNFRMVAICKKLGIHAKDLNSSMENSYWILCHQDAGLEDVGVTPT